jgi:hypothetical protein
MILGPGKNESTSIACMHTAEPKTGRGTLLKSRVVKITRPRSNIQESHDRAKDSPVKRARSAVL